MTADTSRESDAFATSNAATREQVHELRNQLYAASLAFRAICKFIDREKPSAARAAAATMLENLTGQLEDSRDGGAICVQDELNAPIRVLLVEDDDMEAQLLADYLTEKSYSVSRARDGLEALSRLKAEVPDIVLIDMNMPRLDGPKTVRSIRADERLKELTLVAISGATESSPTMQKTRQSVDLWITKPADPRRIAGAILEMARGRRVRDGERHSQTR